MKCYVIEVCEAIRCDVYASMDRLFHREVIACRVAGLSGLCAVRATCCLFLHVTANSTVYSSSLRFMVCTLCSILGSPCVVLPSVYLLSPLDVVTGVTNDSLIPTTIHC